MVVHTPAPPPMGREQGICPIPIPLEPLTWIHDNRIGGNRHHSGRGTSRSDSSPRKTRMHCLKVATTIGQCYNAGKSRDDYRGSGRRPSHTLSSHSSMPRTLWFRGLGICGRVATCSAAKRLWEVRKENGGQCSIQRKNDHTPTAIESNSSTAKTFGAKQKARPTKRPMMMVDVAFLFIVLLLVCFEMPHGRLRPWGGVKVIASKTDGLSQVSV